MNDLPQPDQWQECRRADPPNEHDDSPSAVSTADDGEVLREEGEQDEGEVEVGEDISAL